jgi:Fe-S-cluster containining protein
VTSHRCYDCGNCPAYCCTYDNIPVSDADLARLAKHFGVSERTAGELYTKRGTEGMARVLRHQKDKTFGTACRFLDLESRACTIYDARPHICRAYPGSARCGFYDFLMSERRTQDDPDYVPSFTRG